MVKVLVAQSCPTLRPHGVWPAKLLCPWDSPGKNTGVGKPFRFPGNLPSWPRDWSWSLLNCRQIQHLSHLGIMELTLSHLYSCPPPPFQHTYHFISNFSSSYSPPGAPLVAQLVKNPPAMEKPGFDPWVGKIPSRRAWQPTPVFLPEESHGQRSLEG